MLLRRGRRIVVIIKGLFTMRFSIRVDLFHQFFCIVPGSCWDLFLHLLLRVGVGLDVSTVNEDGLGRQIACLGCLIQNPRKYPIHGLFGEPMPDFFDRL